MSTRAFTDGLSFLNQIKNHFIEQQVFAIITLIYRKHLLTLDFFDYIASLPGNSF